MLSNLASYLGYAACPATTEEEAAVRLRAVEDDDWLLVERREPGSSGDEAAATRRPPPLGSNHLQESWYLTPPPSFSSEGPVHMETSPLENLLIEHPSMSVYQRRSDPCSTASDEDSPRTISLPRKEKLNKLPRNKLNTKYSKKRPPTSSSDEAGSIKSASEDETKEPKMKSFVKSPRRSINAELNSLARKTSRRRLEATSSDELLSIPSTNEEEVVTEVRKKLYSEVLAAKPKETHQQLAKTTPAPEPKPSEALAKPGASMAVEEAAAAAQNVTETTSLVERDRRTVHTIGDQQTRQHLLNTRAQRTEQRKSCDVMKRNLLGRNNKARELNSRNKRQRRADMMQRHSGANNNRKC